MSDPVEFADSQLNKGLGIGKPILNGTSGTQKWNILEEDVSLPTVCVIDSILRSNIMGMFKYARGMGYELCPHVKTTMCPRIIAQQWETGVWGFTTANVQQTLVVQQIGPTKRILMANQLIGKTNMKIISNMLAKHPTLEFYCLVDSVTNVYALAEFFGAQKQRIRVLVEIGVDGGRTGVRTATELAEILQVLKKFDTTLVTSGVEFFEGVLKTETEVRAFCKKAFEALLFMALTFDDGRDLVFSGAGSVWFDVVTDELDPLLERYFPGTDFREFSSNNIVPLLRPGCYAIHDVGMYKEIELRLADSCRRGVSPGLFLEPALKVIAYVQSRPEPTLAIIGFGRRDVSTDVDFPKPFQVCYVLPKNASGQEMKRCFSDCPEHWKIVRVMDQHAFMEISEEDKLNPGDILSFDIVHACNTFCLWRQILLVDESYNVLDVAPTFF